MIIDAIQSTPVADCSSINAQTRRGSASKIMRRGIDQITANIEQAAAAPGFHVADVCGIIQKEAEVADDRADVADASGARNVERAKPLRVRADHECFLNQHTGAVAHGQQMLRVRGDESDRLLAEHVLAGFGGAGRPLDMKMIWQRNVNRIDVGIGDERFVGPVCLRHAEFGCGRSCFDASREAIASTLVHRPRCIAGMTFRVAMRATPSTPHRSFLLRLVGDSMTLVLPKAPRF